MFISLQIRAVMETRVLDYGLENCTFVIHSNKTYPGQGKPIDIYLLPSEKSGEGSTVTFLGRLFFVPGQDSESRPFYCTSRSSIRFELRCPEDDCTVHVPLQGITTRSKFTLRLLLMMQYRILAHLTPSRHFRLSR